jgi:hypothetical protein
MQVLVPAGRGSAQHPLMSTQASPDTQFALVSHVATGVPQNVSCTAQKVLSSVLVTHSQGVVSVWWHSTFGAPHRSAFAGQMLRGTQVPL